jgi:hypothetical protein
MQNPWHALPGYPPYLLMPDQRAVLAHNERVPEVLQVKHNVLPEPYLGRPDAPVLLLNLNPGYTEEDIAFYRQTNVRHLWRKNLLHEKMEYPFWLLDPTLDPEVGGARWWRQKLRELIETAGLKRCHRHVLYRVVSLSFTALCAARRDVGIATV